MATYAVIATSGQVTNIVISDAACAENNFPGAVCIDGLNPMPAIGWMHLNGEWIERPAPPVTPSFGKP